MFAPSLSPRRRGRSLLALILLVSSACALFRGDRGALRELQAATQVILQIDTGAVLLGEMSTAVMVGGRYFSVSADRTRLLRFTATGELDRVIGRTGPGPGEFTGLDVISALRDYVLVSDRGRYHLLTSAGDWVADFPDPQLGCGAQSGRDRIACSKLRSTDGAPFVLIDHSGRAVSEFGDASRAPDAETRCTMCQSWALHADSTSGDVGFASGGAAVVEHWDATTGVRTSRLEYLLPPSLVPTGERQPEVAGADFPRGLRGYGGWRTSTGHVLLVFSVRQESASAPAARPTLSRPRPTLEAFGGYRSVVVLFDRSGRPVAHRVFEGQRVMPATQNLLSVPEYTEAGFVRLRVLRVSLPD